ncbi:3-deoxy-7-phosphoheptulonate synthase [Candidatus Vidania fulgoroideorum]
MKINKIKKYEKFLKNIKSIKNHVKEIKEIINLKKRKFLIIIGPCSINSIISAKIFFKKIKNFTKKYNKYIKIITRVYVEKPRSVIGWKGLIYEPKFRFNLNLGIKKTLQLMKYINKKNMAISTEIVNNLLYNYYKRFISIAVIGARNYESQIHREFCSSLNFPIGFKNGTSGDIQGALNSIISCSKKQNIITINSKNKLIFKKSNGNKNGFLIIRGGNNGENYKFNKFIKIKNIYKNFNKGIIIDASHGNSNKSSFQQKKVVEYICKNMIFDPIIVGIMLESYIFEKNQEDNKIKGLSVTDQCMSMKNSIYCIKLIINSIRINN